MTRRLPSLVRGLSGALAASVLAGAFAAAAAGDAAPDLDRPTGVGISAYRIPFERIDTWRLRSRLDFGVKKRLLRGATLLDAERWVPYGAWTGGMVRAVDRPTGKDDFTRDFLEGENATLVLPVKPSEKVRVVLTLGDAEAPRGPIAVLVNGTSIVRELTTKAGEFADVRFDLTPREDHVAIEVSAAACGDFAVCGASIYTEGRPGRPVRFAPADADSAVLPDPPESKDVVAGARDALMACASFLLQSQPHEGGFSYHGAWYECSFAVRTLLAASRTLGKPVYQDAALACLDRFAAEQHPGGGWSARYFGSPDCEIARETARGEATRNLADVGSMAMALSVAAAGEHGPRRELYLRAARAYADSLVLPAQMESGAFPNGLFEGVTFVHPYTVATATQASNLAALYAMTGEERYRRTAQHAALFLAERVREDGSMEFCPHDTAATIVLGPERMGDLFYAVEALLWVHRIADPESRAVLGAALDRFFLGEATRAALLAPDSWFLKTGAWELSKRAGLLYLVTAYRTFVNPAPELAPFVRKLAALLEDPEQCPLMGVMAPLTVRKSDYALVATGFAGLGLQGLIDPGVLFPPSR